VIARLDTCVTVLDVQDFLRLFNSRKRFHECYSDGLEHDDTNEEGEESIVRLLMEQVELANNILLNKTDLVSADQSSKVQHQIKSLNPTATIVPTQYGRVPDRNLILNTRLFSLEQAENSRGWLYGIGGIWHFVLCLSTPFIPIDCPLV
jgi:G3E family GTPase